MIGTSVMKELLSADTARKCPEFFPIHIFLCLGCFVNLLFKYGKTRPRKSSVIEKLLRQCDSFQSAGESVLLYVFVVVITFTVLLFYDIHNCKC